VSSVLALAAGLLLVADSARADSIRVGSGSWTDTRTAGASSESEMVTTGNWSTTPWVKLEWVISLADGVFTYVYTVSRDGDKAISHFDIEVSPDFGTTDILTGSIGKIELTDPFWEDLTKGKAQPGDVLKFDYGATETSGTWTATYTLVTRRVPVWGDFLMKDGMDKDGTPTIARNLGFGTDPTTGLTNFTSWIPTPDTAYLVPLPPGILAGLGLVGTLVLARRRRARA
jgi:hypothetical protein